MLSDGCESASNPEGRPITQRAGSTSTSGTHDDQWLVPASMDGTTLRTPDSPANREHFGAQG
jgi:hypothetical protein